MAGLKSKKLPQEYFEQLFNLWEQAVSNTHKHSEHFSLCGKNVKFHGAGKQLIDKFKKPFLHGLNNKEETKADLEIFFWDTKSTNINMPPPPWSHENFSIRGDIASHTNENIKTFYNWKTGEVTCLNIALNKAVYWIKSHEDLGLNDYSHPLNSIFAPWLSKNNMLLIHSAAISEDNRAILITGRGNIGKSTTALTCAENGLGYISDDYVVYNTIDKSLYCLFSSGKRRTESKITHDKLNRNLSKDPDTSTEKQTFFFGNDEEINIVHKSKLNAIFIPEITDNKEPKIVKTDKEDIYKALILSSMRYLPGNNSCELNKMKELIEEFPTYKIKLSKDKKAVAKCIQNFIDKKQ